MSCNISFSGTEILYLDPHRFLTSSVVLLKQVIFSVGFSDLNVVWIIASTLPLSSKKEAISVNAPPDAAL